MTPNVATLKAFKSLSASLTSATDDVWLKLWERAEKMAQESDPFERLTTSERAEIDTAWRAWQSAESRDRGYDHETAQRLRRDYYRLVARYTEGEAA